jgi:tetratricopeptide (TPR) repeat protein
MEEEFQSPKPYVIRGGKVVLVQNMYGNIYVTDLQDVNFDSLTKQSGTQVGRLLKEWQTSTSAHYHPEFYESRSEVERHITRFLAGPQPGMFIFGESGVGKSHVLTHLCLQLRENNQVVLLYTGFDFFDDTDVEQRILKDCGCVSQQVSLAGLLETLNALNEGAEYPTSFVVLIDSIERARDPGRLWRVLDSILAQTPYAWFKVIATMQTGAYGAIATEHEERGWKSAAPSKYYLSRSSDTPVDLPGVSLGLFTPTELHGAWNKTQVNIDLKSLPEATHHLIRHPFFFRLFIDTYQSDTDTTPLLKVSSPWELLEKYYAKRLPPNASKKSRNPSRVLLDELINKFLEDRTIWYSVLDLADDTTIGRYFVNYEANKPYADLLDCRILQEHTTPDKTDVRVSFTPTLLFAYALYLSFCRRDDLSVEYLVAIFADLIPGPLVVDLESGGSLDQKLATVQYYQILRSFWYLPLTEAVAHVLADRWDKGGEETFVVKCLTSCYAARLWWTTEEISIKLIEIMALINPEKLGQLIPTMIAVYPFMPLSPSPTLAENRIMGRLFDDLAENALVQEATSIVHTLLIERSNGPDEIVELYLVLARVHKTAGNDQQRLANLLEANQYAIASGNLKKMGRVANAMGVFYTETGNPTTAIQWLEQGAEFAARAGLSPEHLAASHFNIGMALADQGDFPRAISHFEQGLTLVDETKSPLRTAQILSQIGKAQEALRNLSEALRAYQQASSFYETENEIKAVMNLAVPIGRILMMQLQFVQAAAYFRRCLVQCDPILSSYQRFELMANLALALAGIENNTAEATVAFQKATDYYFDNALPLTQDYLMIQLNFARFLVRAKKYSEAITVYTTTLSKFGPTEEVFFRHMFGVELGSIYVQTGDYQLAVKYLADALPSIEATKREDNLADFYEILGDAYRGLGLNAEATECYQKSYPLLLKLQIHERAKKVLSYIEALKEQ